MNKDTILDSISEELRLLCKKHNMRLDHWMLDSRDEEGLSFSYSYLLNNNTSQRFESDHDNRLDSYSRHCQVLMRMLVELKKLE